MNLIWTKVIVAILFGVLRLSFGLLPVKLYSYLKIWYRGTDGVNHVNKDRQKHAECFLTLVQSFGGGVLLATCFLHMMPEVEETMDELKKTNETLRGYPFTQLIICTGFFMVYFVEEVAHYIISKLPEVPCPDKRIQEEGYISTITGDNKINPASPSLNKDSLEDGNTDVSTDSGLEKNAEAPQLTEKELITALEKNPKRLLRCVLITLALSFHAVFEGIAIGLQNSISNIWYLFVAVSIHSVTLLFCVGVELLLSHKRFLIIFLFIFVLAITSPIGVLIGLAVTFKSTESNHSTASYTVFLEGISTGTILYITFFEVLMREKDKQEYRLSRGASLLVGFIVMALLQIMG